VQSEHKQVDPPLVQPINLHDHILAFGVGLGRHQTCRHRQLVTPIFGNRFKSASDRLLIILFYFTLLY